MTTENTTTEVSTIEQDFKKLVIETTSVKNQYQFWHLSLIEVLKVNATMHLRLTDGNKKLHDIYNDTWRMDIENEKDFEQITKKFKDVMDERNPLLDAPEWLIQQCIRNIKYKVADNDVTESIIGIFMDVVTKASTFKDMVGGLFGMAIVLNFAEEFLDEFLPEEKLFSFILGMAFLITKKDHTTFSIVKPEKAKAEEVLAKLQINFSEVNGQLKELVVKYHNGELTDVETSQLIKFLKLDFSEVVITEEKPKDLPNDKPSDNTDNSGDKSSDLVEKLTKELADEKANSQKLTQQLTSLTKQLSNQESDSLNKEQFLIDLFTEIGGKLPQFPKDPVAIVKLVNKILQLTNSEEIINKPNSIPVVELPDPLDIGGDR